tara:strand:+ start:73 stop:489 length:417 start_codon:yes stop_codon:yes gene_type:complete
MTINKRQFITIEPDISKYPNATSKFGYNENKAIFCNVEEEKVMQCPICKFDYTHITGVEVFSRSIEDAEEHVHTKVDMVKNLTKVENVKGYGRNPSARRDGLILSGHCENGHKFEINIAQHKGNTYFSSKKTGTKNFD